MVKPSINAPKRISARPKVSRYGMVLDGCKELLDAGMKFTPVPIGNPKGDTQYRLKLENDNDNIVGLEAIVEELHSIGQHLQLTAVESNLNTLCEIIPKYIAKTGNSVRIGNLVTLKAYATGTIDHENDPADPERNKVEIRATVSPALRGSLSKMRLVNASRKVSELNSVEGGPNKAYDEVDADNEVVLSGSAIYVSVAPAWDESAKGRIWLETLDGVRLGGFDVLSADRSLVRARLRLDAPPQMRDCRLVIETYGTQEAAESGTAPLYSYRRNVRFVGAIGGLA